MGQFSQSIFSRKAIQILVSLSLFSFFPLLPLLLHSLNHYTTTLSLQLFSYSIERNYVFLFCNGILVFVIKNSVLTSNSHLGSDPGGGEIKKHGNFEQSMQEVVEGSSSDSADVPIEPETEKTEETGDLAVEEEDEVEDKYPIREEEEEDGIGLLTADELNQKCEDFIRRMKERIIIEAQQMGHGLLHVSRRS